MKNKINVSRYQLLSKFKAAAAPAPNETYLFNRNPRNLELMKIGYRPDGYHLEQKGRSFWHKLTLTRSGHNVSAQVLHWKNGVVLQANSNEWAIKSQLYSTKDTSAYVNLAKILAQRCLEAGIIEMECVVDREPAGGKVDKFLSTFESNGVALKESERYIKAKPSDQLRMEKPWELVVE